MEVEREQMLAEAQLALNASERHDAASAGGGSVERWRVRTTFVTRANEGKRPESNSMYSGWPRSSPC